MNYINIAQDVFKKEIRALISAQEKIGDEMESAVKLISNSSGKIILSGIGKSSIVAKKIAVTLSSIGIPALFLHPIEAFHGDIGIVQKNDVGLFISKSGETKEILDLLSYFKKKDIQSICISGNKESILARSCDVFLNGSIDEEACPLNLVPTSSALVAIALGDALIACLIKHRGFNSDDYAQYHPGGSLGKRLYLKVKDIMRINNNLPVIKKGSSIKEALIEMTSKALGAVIITENNLLKGIYTDGDLKKTIQNQNNFLNDIIDNFMNINPIIINENCLVIEALNCMENHNPQISVLPVINNIGNVTGIIHIHDILKVGL